jgi:hypothetical protein
MQLPGLAPSSRLYSFDVPGEGFGQAERQEYADQFEQAQPHDHPYDYVDVGHDPVDESVETSLETAPINHTTFERRSILTCL